MKYLFINSVIGFGSTGRLVAEKCHELMAEGHECRVAWGRINTGSESNSDIVTYRIGSKLDNYYHAIMGRLLDREGLASVSATKKLVSYIRDYNPDVIWLHNIHGCYLNYPILFDYIKSRPTLKVYWTFHDCWAMTGHCSHFMISGCDKYISGCSGHCSERFAPPPCYGLLQIRSNYNRKKKYFTGIKDLTIITPCKWMKTVVERSFLKEYPVEVVYNTIDETVFKPTESDFRAAHNLADKTVLLGVASKWNDRKGLSDFKKLSELVRDKNAVVVLVGLRPNQYKLIKGYDNIIPVGLTNSAAELAGLYTMSDAYLNLTYEDNYPSTNLEATACGTLAITYRTGGSPESVKPDCVAERGDIEGVLRILHEHSVID